MVKTCADWSPAELRGEYGVSYSVLSQVGVPDTPSQNLYTASTRVGLPKAESNKPMLIQLLS